MTIAEIERGIIERLKSRLTDIQVLAFPEKPAEFNLTHPKGAVLVSYAGSTFSEPVATDLVLQDRKVEFSIFLLFRSLRGHDGAYRYLDSIRLILTGFRIPPAGKIYMVKEEFLGENAGVWSYGMTFAMKAPAVEVEEEEQLPLLRRITLIEMEEIVEVP